MQGVLGDEYFKARTTTMSCYWQNKAKHDREMEAAAQGDPIAFTDLDPADQRTICVGMHEGIVSEVKDQHGMPVVVRFSDGMSGLQKLGSRNYWIPSAEFLAEMSVREGLHNNVEAAALDSQSQVPERWRNGVLFSILRV